MKKLTTEEFIKRSSFVHKNKYDYSQSIYKTTRDKIKIICPIHGIFYQLSLDHMKGHGCDKCGGTLKITKDIFIKRSNIKHKNKYDYSESEYINNKTKIKIICKKHGAFYQHPDDHMSGHGCVFCFAEKNANTQRKTKKEFIKESISIHGEKYDYSESEYKDMFTSLKIICKKHGAFYQRPLNHIILKQGCNKCNMSHGESEIINILDSNNIKYIYQKKFNDCKNKRKLSFDFYIESINTCIEYDGQHHFEEMKHHKNYSERFIQIQKNDNIKNKYCKNKEITLLRISYKENIKDKLSLILKESNAIT